MIFLIDDATYRHIVLLADFLISRLVVISSCNIILKNPMKILNIFSIHNITITIRRPTEFRTSRRYVCNKRLG